MTKCSLRSSLFSVVFSLAVLALSTAAMPFVYLTQGYERTAGIWTNAYCNFCDSFKSFAEKALDTIKPTVDGIAFSQLMHDAYAIVAKRLELRASAPVRFATMGVHFA